ncbi:MAG: type III-B CRISPR module RAMP protein Cmr4 [Chthonomonadales bacterium]
MAAAKMVFLHAITPVHSGTGQAASVIDLPVAREKATGWPIIPASSFKGVLRDVWTSNGNGSQVDVAFGTQNQAGALCFGDLRVLCLPVRSFFGTFAYVTCPLALHRFKRDADALGAPVALKEIPAVDGTKIVVTQGTQLRDPDGKNQVFLEDLDLEARDGADAVAGELARQVFDNEEDGKTFKARFAIVSDEVFSFLCDAALEVVARVRLNDDTKTVESGGLWYEEAVPAETVFAGPVVLAGHAKDNGSGDLLAQLKGGLIQIGGDASVGRGLCRMVVAQ